MIDIIILFLFALFMRLAAIRGEEINQFDSYGHLYYAKELKAQGQGPFGSIKVKVISNEGSSLPFLWHWILGFFSIPFIIKHQKYWNPIIDSFFAILIYMIALRLGLSNHDSLLAYALYIFTPMWFSRLAIGPRVNSFTPRLSGEIVANLFYIIVCLPIDAPHWALLLGGGLLSGYVIASSKFGIQALLFLTPLVSLLLFSWLPLLALALGVLIVSFASKLKFLNHIKKQFSHLKYYFQKNLIKEAFAKNGDSAASVCWPKGRQEKILDLNTCIL